ncbi:MAG: lysylphosphatidylglycerol synthase transmembrane domain-containing protein [Infirmifilum sp.]
MLGALKKIVRRHILTLIQLVFVLALAAYILQGFDVNEFFQAISHAKIQLLAYLVIFEISYYLFHAMAFWALTRARFRIKVQEALGGTMLAWLVDLILPSAFIEGDIVRIVFLKQYGDWATSISYNLFFRFLLNTTLAVFILAATIFAINLNAALVNYIFLYVLTVLLAFLSASLIAIFIFDAKKTLRIVSFIIRKLPVKKKEVLEEEADKFLGYVSESAKDFSIFSLNLWVAILCLLGQWISGIMTPYFSLKSVGVDINPVLIAPGYTILTVFSLASIGVPFMVGSVDVALITLYLLLGVPKERAIVAAFLGRGITILVTLSLIYPIGLYYGKKVFSKGNIEGLKEAISNFSKEYGINLPFFAK